MSGVTSWASELPSGHNPFWIKDEALADLDLHPGQAVGIDTRREPVDGDLVLAEVELEELIDRVAANELSFIQVAGGALGMVAGLALIWPLLLLPIGGAFVLAVMIARVAERRHAASRAAQQAAPAEAASEPKANEPEPELQESSSAR